MAGTPFVFSPNQAPQNITQSGTSTPVLTTSPNGSIISQLGYGQTAPASEPSVLSTETGRQVLSKEVQNHQDDLGRVSGSKTTDTSSVDKTTGDAKSSPTDETTTAMKSAGGVTPEEATAAGVDLNQYTYDVGTGYFLPKNGTQQSADTFSADKKSIEDSFSEQMRNMDASTAALIGSITGIYSDRMAQQKDINQRQLASTNTANIRNGTSRYAGGVADSIFTAEENSGMERLRAIANEEASHIAQANENLQNKKYSAFMDERAAVNKLKAERAATLKDLQDKAITAQKEQKALIQKNKDDIASIALSAAKNGASAQILKAINSSKNMSEAIAAAGDSLQTATGDLGDYLQYKRDMTSRGLVPYDYQTYKNNQLATEEKIKNDAKNSSDAAYTASDKTQQKLEQQYRGVLSKEFSSRTGSLGIENGKVSQANHLNSLVTQYYDPKTKNYNIPTAQYAELILGLASLVSPGGTTAAADRAELMSKTAAGDLKGAVQYITGVPQNGNTQDIIKNIVDSIDRQAETAVRNREAALQNMRDQAPTDLDPSRIDKLNKSTQMVSYEGKSRIDKSTVNDFVTQHGTEQFDGNQSWQQAISALYKVPGATDKDVVEYLKARGKI